jgi:hypothetical protein
MLQRLFAEVCLTLLMREGEERAEEREMKEGGRMCIDIH